MIDALTQKAIAPILRENISHEARLMTDEAKFYNRIGREFAEHHAVNHGAGEYIREPQKAAQGSFGI